ncbi:MAG: endonuclease/exonuclease/phosphatase family protein [Candidatus Sumerlaeia bacterium]|nr:endonuclease/exonuclease/phosphatase family protein [Candidatus Sumerlaeia bacterium]
MRRFLMRVLSWAGIIGNALLVLSLLLRFLISDRIWPLNYNSYIPSPAYILAALVVPWFLPVRWWLRVAAFVVVLPAGIFTLYQEHPRLLVGGSGVRAPSAGEDIRMLTWNVQAYHGGMDEIIEAIQHVDPDILCLVEGTFGDRSPEQVRRALGRDYQWAVGRRLSIASRIPIRESQQATLSRSMWSFRAVFEPADGVEFALLLVDVNPPFRRSEGDVFQELWMLRETEYLPLVMTGDFNTPRHSRRLAGAIGGMRNAVEEAGEERWWGTWPAWGIPLWQLDYTFFDDNFLIHDARLKKTEVSDHHGVVVEFSLPAE